MINALITIFWFAVWFITLLTSLGTAHSIFTDVDLDDSTLGVWGVCVLGWTTIILFFFN